MIIHRPKVTRRVDDEKLISIHNTQINFMENHDHSPSINLMENLNHSSPINLDHHSSIFIDKGLGEKLVSIHN
jgi:predicted ribosome-associated RNA-binding protein Tma20